jgi:hypothetical protein
VPATHDRGTGVDVGAVDVEMAGEAGVRTAQSPRQCVRPSWYTNQMRVVRHQAVGQDRHFVPPGVLPQKAPVEPAVEPR